MAIKGVDGSPQFIRHQVEESLKRLNTDHIDLWGPSYLLACEDNSALWLVLSAGHIGNALASNEVSLSRLGIAGSI